MSEIARRLLFSVMTIALAVMMVGVGVSAIFSDTETSTGNRITTSGSPDLLLQEGTQLGEGVEETWVMSNMIPGLSLCGNTINLYNKGDRGACVNISVINTCSDLGPEKSDTVPGCAEGMDKYLQIIVLDYTYPVDATLIRVNLLHEGVDSPLADDDDLSTLWNEMDDMNGNGWIDLDDFEGQGISNLPAPPPLLAGYTSLCMTVRFHQDAPSGYQGDRVEMTMILMLED